MNKISASTKDLIPFFSESLENGKSISVTITGNSMFPLFSHMRDTVTVKKAVGYSKGDIVMYIRTNGELVIHRIIGKKNGAFVLCGDNQSTPEFPIYPNQIMGKVCNFVRKGKNISARNLIYKLYVCFWCLGLRHRKPALNIALHADAKLNAVRRKGR